MTTHIKTYGTRENKEGHGEVVIGTAMLGSVPDDGVFLLIATDTFGARDGCIVHLDASSGRALICALEARVQGLERDERERKSRLELALNDARACLKNGQSVERVVQNLENGLNDIKAVTA